MKVIYNKYGCKFNQTNGFCGRKCISIALEKGCIMYEKTQPFNPNPIPNNEEPPSLR